MTPLTQVNADGQRKVADSFLDKLRFLSVTLPLLGVAGGIARVVGTPPLPTNLTLIITFTAIYLIVIIRAETAARRSDASEEELQRWHERELVLQAKYAADVERQQAGLELLRRQKAEREEMAEKEKELSERHQREYQELLQRDTA